jgi:DnaJ-class molecular chaperone
MSKIKKPCLHCNGSGREPKDWVAVIVFLGAPLLDAPKECSRCDGFGYKVVEL